MWQYLLLLFLVLLIPGLILFYHIHGKGRNPFSQGSVQSPRPLVTDQEARRKVLKKAFSPDKVPPNLDAIVIGSGIGGLSVAAVLAKAGKRILVLEQHRKAGGCCHTFQEKGFEFDVGIHYVGQMHKNGMLRVIMDQLTNGHLDWVQLEDPYDIITLGDKDYTLYCGKKAFGEELERQFPEEKEVIKEFIRLSKTVSKHVALLAVLKMIPLWLSMFLIQWGLIHWISPVFRLACSSHSKMATQLTSNKKLQAIFSYFFYGEERVIGVAWWLFFFRMSQFGLVPLFILCWAFHHCSPWRISSLKSPFVEHTLFGGSILGIFREGRKNS